MATAYSATTFILDHQLPWASAGVDRQEEGPYDSGAIFDKGQRHACLLRAVSPTGVTVQSTRIHQAGQQLSVELPTGQRSASTVAWARNNEAGLAFAKSIDIVALINRSLINQAPERRAMPRVSVSCPALIKYGPNLDPVSLRNISPNGLQLQGAQLPAKGTFVSVLIEGLVVPAGEVVWRKGDLAGVELFEQLNWTSVMPWIRGLRRTMTC